MKDEHTIQQDIQIAARTFDCHLMRNNSGSLKDKTGRPVRYGLGNISKKHNDKIKSSDLIGFTKIVITPDMVGKTFAIFTAVEVKKEEWNPNKKLDADEQAQLNFINWVRANGGFATFLNSLDRMFDIFK